MGERWTSGGTGDRETPALFTTLPACSPCTPPSVKTPSLASVQYIKMVDPAADLRPDHWQLVTLIVIGVYVLLIMFVWNLPGVKSVLPVQGADCRLPRGAQPHERLLRGSTHSVVLLQIASRRALVSGGLLYAVHTQQLACMRGRSTCRHCCNSLLPQPAALAWLAALARCWLITECSALCSSARKCTTQAGHALACVVTGGRVESITLDPDLGGLTVMRGGIQCCTLPAGAPAVVHV